MFISLPFPVFFFFTDTATTAIYTLSLHDALPISGDCGEGIHLMGVANSEVSENFVSGNEGGVLLTDELDRKSTRLNSSHPSISYAVFCLKKKSYEMSRRAETSTTASTACVAITIR